MIKIKIEDDIPGYKKGQIVNVDSDINGVPKTLFWRRRLRDSKIDGRIKIIDPPKEKTPKRKEER